MLKRKHKLMMGDVRPKNSDGETQQAKAGFAVDGLDEIFTTKAAMKRAWAQTQSRTGTPALTNISTADSRKLPAAADEYHVMSCLS